MAQEGLSANKEPLFDGFDYEFWKVRMKAYFMALGIEAFQSIMNGSEILENAPRDQIRRKACENNVMERNFILCGLSNSEFVKIMNCKIVKEEWDKLHNIYEGCDQVKE